MSGKPDHIADVHMIPAAAVNLTEVHIGDRPSVPIIVKADLHIISGKSAGSCCRDCSLSNGNARTSVCTANICSIMERLHAGDGMLTHTIAGCHVALRHARKRPR